MTEKLFRLFLTVLISINISSCIVENDIDITKYPIITSVKELSEFYNISLDATGKYENSLISTYFDGSRQLTYSYEDLEGRDGMPLFYDITIDLETSLKDAALTYSMSKGAFKLGGSLASKTFIEIDNLYFGENFNESFYAYQTIDRDTTGIVFITRKGKNIFSLVVDGLYDTSHSMISDLIIPKIKNLETFKL